MDVHFGQVEFFFINVIFKPRAREHYRLNALRCEHCQCQVHFCHSSHNMLLKERTFLIKVHLSAIIL